MTLSDLLNEVAGCRWRGAAVVERCGEETRKKSPPAAFVTYYVFEMTPAEKSIVKSLVAVAWADGQMESSEASVVEGLLVGFDASESEEREILEWAKTPRTLETDIPVAEFTVEDKELLLSNAALLTLADGQRTLDEAEALSALIRVLEMSEAQAKAIIGASEDGALRLSSRSLS